MHVIVLKFGLPLAPRRVQIVARGGVGKTLFKKNVTRCVIMYLSLDSGVITKNLHIPLVRQKVQWVATGQCYAMSKDYVCVRACVRTRMSHLLQLTSI